MALDQQPALPSQSHPETLDDQDLSNLEIVEILNSYRFEADEARKTGPAPRDLVWEQNVNLYWNHFDYSKKAAWQSKEAMPEAPMFVDRWAAAMKEALIQSGDWYTVTDPADKENAFTQSIKKFIDVWLDRCGRNQTGQPIAFPAVFEELMKLAGMMAAGAAVVWKTDRFDRGYVSIEPVDPREIWLDPTGRGLYRIRRFTVDLFRLKQMAKMKDGAGKAIYDTDAVDQLTSFVAEEERTQRSRLAGHGNETTTKRKPITIDEYLCTLIDNNGEVVHENALFVVANERFLIRGPETNPFWHGHDWLIYCAPISVPLSVYGRSYMENWSSVARTFVELTNLLVDATYTTSMKAFAAVPSMLEDPTELDDGVFPNKTFTLEDGADPNMFLTEIDLGSLPSGSFNMWTAIKQELREGAAFNEIALGQLAPKGDTTATEISETQQSSASLLRSIANSIETRFLNPMLDLVWKTGLQHMSPEDEELRAALGDETFQMFLQRREELAKRRITFRASGLSAIIARGQKLRSLMSALQVFGSNEILAQVFFTEKADPRKLLDTLMTLMGIDATDLQPTPTERQMGSVLNAQQQLQQTASTQGSSAKPPGESGQLG